MNVRALFFGVVLAVLAVAAAMLVEPFATYVVAAALLAFLLAPAQDRLSAVVGDRAAAFSLVVLSVVAALVPLALVLNELLDEATRLAAEVEGVPVIDEAERTLEGVLGADVALEEALRTAPRQFADLAVGPATRVLDLAVHTFLGLALLVFLLYYLLRDGRAFVEWTRAVAPLAPAVRDELYAETYDVTWAVLKGHVFIAVLQGLVAGVGLYVAAVPNAAFWTTVMVFLELFPVLGVAGVLGPAAFYLFLQDRLLAAAFLVVYGLTAVAVVDDYLRAVVIDRQSSLHSAVILLGVFGGVYAFGVMGLFVGPIALGAFAAAIRVFDEYYAPDD